MEWMWLGGILLFYGFCSVGTTNLILHEKPGFKLTSAENCLIALGPAGLMFLFFLDIFTKFVISIINPWDE